MKFLSTVIILIIGSSAFAQRQNVYFLKNNGKYVDLKDSADYVRVVREPDSASVLYNVFEFYLDGKKKLIGKSSVIDPPKFEGQCVEYYKNGSQKALGNFKDGLMVGLSYEFYTNGKLYIIREYPDNKDLYNDLNDNFLIKASYDSLGTVRVENGVGYYSGYDADFKYINEEGKVKNGKRDSVWKGYYKNVETTFIETYKDGILIIGTGVDKDGKSTSYTKARSAPPEFKGGVDAFGIYLSKNIYYPDFERESNIQGKVILSFVVEKDGKIKDIKVNKSVSPGIDHEAVRVLKSSPLWVPGIMFGKPVRVAYGVPISFSLSD
ncbi:MAG TPA: TonB family protein [Mucilaginibacter sp.]|jgi:TonB family protein